MYKGNVQGNVLELDVLAGLPTLHRHVDKKSR
jgi:hypothetical protein